MSVEGDTRRPVISGHRTNRTGTAAGVLGIAAAFGWLLPALGVLGSGGLLVLVLAILALVFGVVGTMKGRREGLPIGMAIAGLSIGLLIILLFLGFIVWLYLAWPRP